MHPGSPQNPRIPSWLSSAPDHAESNFVAEGYPVYQTAIPGVYNPLMYTPCPMTPADAFMYGYRPNILHAKDLIPIVQPNPPHQNMLWQQHAGILSESFSRLEEMIRDRQNADRAAATIRKAKATQEVSKRVKALSDPMYSGGGYRGFSGVPPVAKRPLLRTSGDQPVIFPSNLASDKEPKSLDKGLMTLRMDFPAGPGETENQTRRQPEVLKMRDAQEKLDPSSTRIAEDSAKLLEQKDNSNHLSTPLNKKSQVSRPHFPSNEIGGSGHDSAELRTSVSLANSGNFENLQNVKLARPRIKSTTATHLPASGKTVAPVNYEYTATLTETNAAKMKELTRQNIGVASHNQDEAFSSVDTLLDQKMILPHETGKGPATARAMAMPVQNKFTNNLEFPKINSLEQPKTSLSEPQKALVAPESTDNNLLLKKENVQISKAKKYTGVSKKKKKYIARVQEPVMNNQALNLKSFLPNAWTNTKHLTALEQPHITLSDQNTANNKAKAPPSPKLPVNLWGIDVTNPNNQVSISKPTKKDAEISSRPGSFGGGTGENQKMAQVNLHPPEINDVKQGYQEVLGNEDVVLVPAEGVMPVILDQISNQEHPVLASPEHKEIKEEGADDANLRLDQISGNEKNKEAVPLQVDRFDESKKLAGVKAPKQKKKKKNKIKGAKPSLDDDWKFLEELEQQQNAKIKPEREIGVVGQKNEKEDEGKDTNDMTKGKGNSNDLWEGIEGLSEEDRKNFLHGPVFHALNMALIPGNEEDQIYPGLPQPKIQRAERTYKNLQKNLETWTLYVNTWRTLGLDLDLMESISTHLKIDNKTNHLPLSDLNDHTYEVLRDLWHRSEERMHFLANFQWWMKDILSAAEFCRRIKTLAHQVYERTVVENWKLIRKHLITTSQLTEAQAKKVEKFFGLRIQFSFFSTVLQQEEPLNLRAGRDIIATIKKSLGIDADIMDFKSEKYWDS
ncbi:hypothetical protein PtB15_4B446 [Puccinia triticina]|nr:hypothetical protein PtB15_4B446 [Puccinia triticina]